MKRPSKKEAVVEYRRAKHSIKETAEHFGIKEQTVKSYCAGERIGYSSANGSNKPFQEREENAKKLIESNWPQWEYVGGYSGSESDVKIKCRKCGTIMSKSMISFRHHDEDKKCSVCSMVHIGNTLVIDTYMRHWEAVEKDRVRRERARKHRKEYFYGPHECPVCGTITTRKKYCSKKCLSKVLNTIQEAKRRKFMKTKLVDKDITLRKLFDKDNGSCWICGLRCDYTDYIRTEKAFIAGGLYPSIDHIVPRCRGGEHSWANVRLAHRRCNTARYNREERWVSGNNK